MQLEDRNKGLKKDYIIIALVLMAIVTIFSFLDFKGWSGRSSRINDLRGSITGNTYECQFYSNTGNPTMKARGTNIDISENIVNYPPLKSA